MKFKTANLRGEIYDQVLSFVPRGYSIASFMEEALIDYIEKHGVFSNIPEEAKSRMKYKYVQDQN